MEQSQFTQYIAVLILLGLAIASPFGMIAASTVLGQRGQRSKIKDTAYECGMIPIGEGSPGCWSNFFSWRCRTVQ